MAFKLIVNPEVQDATLAVRWCVDAETMEKIKEEVMAKNGSAAYVLLVAIPKENDADSEYWAANKARRWLVPLKQGMEYLQLRHSGDTKIFAVIFVENHKRLWRRFMIKKASFSGVYSERIFAAIYGGDGFVTVGYEFIYSSDDYIAMVELNVNVPPEVFAPEPHEWQKKWVNYMFNTDPIDQCQFRKRKWFWAYPFQPFALALYAIGRVLAGISVIFLFWLLGYRGLRLKPMIPFKDYSFNRIWDERKFSFRIKRVINVKRKKGECTFYQDFLLPLTPWFVIMVFMIVAFLLMPQWKDLSRIFSQLWSVTGKALSITGGVIGSLMLLIALIDHHEIKEMKKEKIPNVSKQIEVKKHPKPVQVIDWNRYEFLTCDRPDIKPQLKSLPPEARTLYLRFKDFKAKVCRPFAG